MSGICLLVGSHPFHGSISGGSVVHPDLHANGAKQTIDVSLDLLYFSILKAILIVDSIKFYMYIRSLWAGCSVGLDVSRTCCDMDSPPEGLLQSNDFRVIAPFPKSTRVWARVLRMSSLSPKRPTPPIAGPST
jgi:hypothetical protein